jgi:TP901 family phage tail tape measure protein
MSNNNNLHYGIDFSVRPLNVFNVLNQQINQVSASTQKMTVNFRESWKPLLSANQFLEGIRNLKSALDGAIQPGISLNTSLTDLSAITGLTGKALDEISDAARASAIAFGTDAAQNVESYKLLLSQLSPDIAKNSVALKLMGDHVNILSKTMGGNTVAATEVLTTAMNQYGVSLTDPMQASKTMADMMNIMAAAAKEGSAELPQIKSALEQVGMVAKTTGVTFSETNAAIQVLDKAGKKGAEGGVALRNALSTLSEGRFLPKQTKAELEAAGVSIAQLGDKSVPLSNRLNTLKPIINDTALITKLFGKAQCWNPSIAKRHATQLRSTRTIVSRLDKPPGLSQLAVIATSSFCKTK